MFTTHIANTVLFPKINHVIQATPLNQAQYKKLEAPTKTLIKNKYHINPRLNSTTLEDKNLIGMDNVEETHTDNIISNCLVILRSDNIAGKIMRAHSELIANIEKMNTNILETPLLFSQKKKKSIIYHLSHILAEKEESFRKLTDGGNPSNIILNISPHNFQIAHDIIKKISLKEITDLIKNEKIISFNELFNNLKKQTATAIHKKYPENTPTWYIEMIQPFVKTK